MPLKTSIISDIPLITLVCPGRGQVAGIVHSRRSQVLGAEEELCLEELR